jgi:hypothetical protein
LVYNPSHSSIHQIARNSKGTRFKFIETSF